MIDTNIIASGSEFAGFKNYMEATFSTSYAGGSIGAGSYVGPIIASTPLNNTNAVSEAQIQYVGLDTFWRLIPGSLAIDYPTAGTRQYQVNTLVYFTGGNLVIDNYVVNQTGGSVSVPAITFNCRGFLFLAPF